VVERGRLRDLEEDGLIVEVLSDRRGGPTSASSAPAGAG
jgi:hypothetical protein